MNSLRLLELESQFVMGCRDWFTLRLWEDCGSFDSSSIEDRIRIATEVLNSPYRGTVMWGMGGHVKLIAHFIEKLNDDNPLIRQEAAVALADRGPEASRAISVFLERLGSATVSPHDRALAAWVLPRIGASERRAVPVLLAAIYESAGIKEADELRERAVETVLELIEPFAFRTLVPLARLCLQDRAWKCRLIGLSLAEDLLTRTQKFRRMLLPFVEPLLNDEVSEVQKAAKRILVRFSKAV